VSASRTLAGMALAILALMCFAVLDTATQWMNLQYPVLMALWFRYVFQAIATTAVMMPVRGRALFHTQMLGLQALRGALLLVTSLFTFVSLKYMPVGEFTAIAMITPLAVTLLAATWLKEPVSRVRWLLVAGGFAGSLIIIRPGDVNFSWVMLLPLGMVGSYACFQILTSRMVKTEDAVTMHVYTGWAGTALASLALPFVWTLPANAAQWGGLLLMGAMGTIGHFMLIQAFRRIPAATFSPLLYSQIGFALLGGWLVFSHIPDPTAMAGIVMIAVCGAGAAWLALRENQRRFNLAPLEV
jgi:drug/metabolite transporter (DMT)-like permease